MHEGDEPHCLVMVQSLIDDGDLNLTNNYADAQGAWGLLVDTAHGILSTAPIMALGCGADQVVVGKLRTYSAVAVRRALLCAHQREGVWDGGWCCGPRLVLPILAVGLLGLPTTKLWRALAAAVLLVAFHFYEVYGRHPITVWMMPASS